MILFLPQKKLRFLLLCFLATLAICFALSSFSHCVQLLEPITFRILDQPTAPVNKRLFGHLLERASWGEPGPEGSLQPGTRQIQPEAVNLMQQMNIPLIRFPGGTDVDYIDWRDLISNVPGRDPERPVTIGHTGKKITNQFGLDEYFQLRDQLGVETILVTNFLDAVSRKVPLKEAALNAAGLVAYVNAPIGTTLPPGLPDWVSVRAKNGHPEPYKVEYLQIGNEWWIEGFQKRVRKGTGINESTALAQWYLQCLKAYIAAIDSVDPTITLIIDGTMGNGIEQTVLTDSTIRNRVKYVTFHQYAPGSVKRVTKAGKSVHSKDLSATDWWQALVAMPGDFSKEGVNIAIGDRTQFARSLGYKVAITEWNWNGWGFKNRDLPSELNWRLASSIGTAGFLNGLMRSGNDIEIACQSLLIGIDWNITSIRVDPAAQRLPYFQPQGQMALFYSNHHSSTLLGVESAAVPSYRQPFSIGWARSPENNVAYVDLVATADEKVIYIHAINRAPDRDLPITLDLSSFSSLGKTATHHLFAARSNLSQDAQNQEVGAITEQSLPLSAKTLAVTLPKQSVSIFAISRLGGKEQENQRS